MKGKREELMIVCVVKVSSVLQAPERPHLYCLCMADRVQSWRAESAFEDSLPAPSAVTARELTLKLLLLGDVMVGKTSLAQRYVNNIFMRAYKETIGGKCTTNLYGDNNILSN